MLLRSANKISYPEKVDVGVVTSSAGMVNEGRCSSLPRQSYPWPKVDNTRRYAMSRRCREAYTKHLLVPMKRPRARDTSTLEATSESWTEKNNQRQAYCLEKTAPQAPKGGFLGPGEGRVQGGCSLHPSKCFTQRSDDGRSILMGTSNIHLWFFLQGRNTI